MNTKNEEQKQPKIQALNPENKAEELTDEKLDEVSGGFYRGAQPYMVHDRLYSEVYLVINRPR